jgi:putative acetyltransferase
MLTIRPELARDVPGIYAVNAASFPTEAEARLVDQLRAAGRLVVSLIAEVDGQVVGHVGFSPVTAQDARDGIGLAPVAVRESHRRRGIANQLIEAGLLASREAGYQWCVVLGDPRYYSRFGFRPATSHGLSDEYRGGDAFQVVALKPSGIPTGAGLVRYAPEFSAFA